MGHIFISYSHKDRTYANKLQRHLLNQGFEAWIDGRIDYGTHWTSEIEKRLRDCEAFILIMSPAAYESEWVQNELNLARKLKKPIFPLLLEGEEWWHIGTTQYVDIKGGKLPDTKFYVRLAEVSSRKWADGRGSGDPHPAQKESLPQNVSIHISGDVTGNIVVGTENKVEASAQVRKMEDMEKREREARERETREREAAEKAVLIQAELEAAEKSAREQAERKALEKDIREKLERETAEKGAYAGEFNETVPNLPSMAKVVSDLPQLVIPARWQLKKAWFPRKEVIAATIVIVGILLAVLYGFLGDLVWKNLLAALAAHPTLTETAAAALPTTNPPIQTLPPPATATPILTPIAEFAPTVTPLPVEITEKGANMALIPAGTFTMGSDNGSDDEKPPHQVSLDVFYMDVYEVTNALYKACVEASACPPPRSTDHYSNSIYADHPVVYVNWSQAKTYCEWRGARLPTEAEWEYTARGTDGRTYPWGEGIDKTYANYKKTAGDTSAVGSYEKGKSFFGVYDMVGNVWEWVDDWYDAYPGNMVSNSDYGAKYRALRGGTWYPLDRYVRSASRFRYNPSYSNSNIGFRCSRSP